MRWQAEEPFQKGGGAWWGLVHGDVTCLGGLISCV